MHRFTYRPIPPWSQSAMDATGPPQIATVLVWEARRLFVPIDPVGYLAT